MRTDLLLLPVALATVLALTGCDRLMPARDKAEPAAAASNPETGPGPAPGPASADAAAPVEQAGEVPLDDLTGIWRVTGVVPGKGSAYAADDARIVGSLMDVLPDQLRWSYKASNGFAADDVCLGPVAGIIDDSDYAGVARKLIAPAIARLRAKVSRLSRPHQWLCGDGGSWGEDTEFQQLAAGRIAMRWTGDVTLILERIRRVSTNPAPLPPTGAYEDR